MKRIYEFITKTNQILIFLATLGVLAGITYLFYQATSTRYQPPHVAIAQTPEEIKRVVVDDVRFLGDSSGIYIFGIIKREVAPSGQPTRRGEAKVFGSFSGSERENGEIVNVVFSKDGRKVKTLLEADGLVLSYAFSGQYRAEKFKPLLFSCVTEDTDGNHVFDKNDRNDLYIVSDDLGKPDMVIHGLLGYDIVSNSRIIIKTREHDILHFYDIDTDTSERKEVIWK